LRSVELAAVRGSFGGEQVDYETPIRQAITASGYPVRLVSVATHISGADWDISVHLQLQDGRTVYDFLSPTEVLLPGDLQLWLDCRFRSVYPKGTGSPPVPALAR
jgi:hypothetical protein